MFLLLFACLPVTWAEQPEQRWYKVEVVAFSYLPQIRMAQERWPGYIQALDLSDAVKLSRVTKDQSGPAGPIEFQRLPDSELELKPDAHAISRSKGRRLLLHTAWLQKTFDRQQARAVHLTGDELFTPLPEPGFGNFEQSDFQRGDTPGTLPPPTEGQLPMGQPITTAKEPEVIQAPQIYIPALKSDTTARSGRTGAVPADIPGPDTNILDGSFTVSIGRYLHVWLDFIYREPVAISPETKRDYREYVLVPYRVEMHRRMRSNELHYIDHPKLGMLVKITRYKIPQTVTPVDVLQSDLPIATDVIPAQ